MSFVDKLLPKDKPQEYFLTLKVGIETLQAIVWEVAGNKILITGRGKSTLTEEKDFTLAADEAISNAEKTLPQGKLVEKVIFGLPFEFTHDNKIKSDVLTKLKSLTHTLSLKPLGFIELPEALAHFLTTKESSPTSAILLGINKHTLTVSFLRVGKIYENIIFPRGEYFTQDVETALKSLKGIEVLPSKVLLYDENEDLEKLREELIKHPWHNKAAFLHFPKIEIITDDDLIHALVESAASEIIKTVTAEEFKHEEEQPSQDKIAKEEVGDEASLMGFHKNKDVLSLSEETAPEENPEEHSSPSPSQNTSLRRLPKFNFRLPALPQIKLPGLPRFKFLPLIIIVFLLLVMGGAGTYAYYQLPQADIRLLVSPQKMQKDIDITLSPNTSSVDTDTLSIPATKVELDVSGDKQMTTTGKKNVGNPSRGTVTIYNKTTSSKSFPKGTSLTVNNLKFSLESDSTVASASDTGEGLTYGKADTKVVASSIGPDGNLSSGTTFAFGDFLASSYTAKNNDALSGGTSRQVSVVSSADQEKLLESLSNELKEKAKDELYQKIGSDEKILDESINISIGSKKYDKNVDTEASSLSLALVAKIEGLSYNTADLNELAKDVLVNNMPPGFEFSGDSTSLKIDDFSIQKDGSLTAKAIVGASLLPTLPLEKIQKDLSGKTVSEAEDYLRNERNITGVEFNIRSPLPFGKKTLPLRPSNIHLIIAGS